MRLLCFAHVPHFGVKHECESPSSYNLLLYLHCTQRPNQRISLANAH